MDPNQVIGTPKEREVWLAPGWTDYKPVTAKQPSGYTRVSVRDVTYADGRVVTYVLDENHRPINGQVLEQTTDPDQQRTFKEQEASARAAQGGVKPTNVYIGTNPSTGKPTEVSEWPDGHKSYDDTKVPAAATETPASKRTAREEAEIAANAALPAGQDPRPETNAERAARADARIKQQGADARQAQIDQEARDAKNRPAAVATNTTEPYIVQAGPDGKLITTPNPNYQGEKPQRSTVKGGDGKTYVVTVDKEGKATAAPVEGLPPEDKGGWRPTPAGAPVFTPDPSDPSGDFGLMKYHQTLMAYARANPDFQRADGEYLIAQAGQAALAATGRRTSDQSQANTARGQDITQRGQDLTEVASRRGAANSMYGGLEKEYNDLALQLSSGDARLAARAFRAALEAGQVNAEQWGGMTSVPQVSPAYLQATRGTVPGSESTQVVSHPDGRIEVSPPGSPPPVPAQNAGQGTGEPPARGVIPTAGPSWMPSTGDPNNPTNETNPNAVGMQAPDPYGAVVGAARTPPPFQPDIARLRAQFPDATDAELQQAIDEHMAVRGQAA